VAESPRNSSRPRALSYATRLRSGAPEHSVTAIGCGTSLGAEGFPVSYNIVHWNDQRRQWMARFFESKNGGPFVPKLITTMRNVEGPVEQESRS